MPAFGERPNFAARVNSEKWPDGWRWQRSGQRKALNQMGNLCRHLFGLIQGGELVFDFLQRAARADAQKSQSFDEPVHAFELAKQFENRLFAQDRWQCRQASNHRAVDRSLMLQKFRRRPIRQKVRDRSVLFAGKSCRRQSPNEPVKSLGPKADRLLDDRPWRLPEQGCQKLCGHSREQSRCRA